MNSPSVGQLLALMLALIMLYLGLTLQVADFKRVWQRPTALAAGLTGQLLMLPLLGFVVANWLSLDPLMAVGLMVLVACPGGVSSGLLTHLARGEVALSISLTAVTSVAAMLTLPLVVNLSMHFFLAQSDPVAFDLATMVRSIFLLTTLPARSGAASKEYTRGQPVLVTASRMRMSCAVRALTMSSRGYFESGPLIGSRSIPAST
jgi:BASS family bile acid:Na+ symporter